MELVLRGNRVRANWGRWVIDCPSPVCAGAVQVWKGQSSAYCADCDSFITELVWPADPQAIDSVTRVSR